MTIIEKLDYITPDGQVLPLHNPPSRVVTEITGWGEPSKQVDTRRGAYQHGETIIATWLEPREVSCTLRLQTRDRDAYWSMRQRLNNALRHSRTEPLYPRPGVLRRTLSNGQVRCLDVVLMEGLAYTNPGANTWDEWGIFEQLKFMAHNPVIYDPQQYLITPLTGFNSTPTQTRTVVYTGTWAEYPIMTVTGPTDGFAIRNLTTGHELYYIRTVKAGEVITIDLRYGEKSLTSNLDGPVTGYLDMGFSDMGVWSLQPDPVAPQGINQIEVQTYFTQTTATKFEMSYYLRYESI